MNDIIFEQAARCLKALAHPTRLKIINLLMEQELTVQELEKSLNTSQSNTSQHLGIMKDKKILISRKEANLVYYKIADKRLIEMLNIFKSIVCE